MLPSKGTVFFLFHSNFYISNICKPILLDTFYPSLAEGEGASGRNLDEALKVEIYVSSTSLLDGLVLDSYDVH